MSGRVFIVGAGPGDPGLLTVKALKAIKLADVVLCDDLVGSEIRELLEKLGKTVIEVGKRSGRHKKSQEEINELMVNLAREGKTVVRLKGGDPFVFGRGGEEIEFLAENGVEFEVVPGVSSSIAAPSYAGIPVTHRRYDPALVIMTGRQERERLNWEALAKLNATVVILMGVGKLEEIAKNLIEKGKNPETPVAIVQSGTTEEQRVVTGKLKDIVEVARREVVEPPAVIVVGGVVEILDKVKEFVKNVKSSEKLSVKPEELFKVVAQL